MGPGNPRPSVVLKSPLERPFMDEKSEADLLKKEFFGLFKYIKRVREEIAAINRPADKSLHFDSKADQLDAIVQAT